MYVTVSMMRSKTIFSRFLSTQNFKTGQVGRQGDADTQTGERGGLPGRWVEGRIQSVDHRQFVYVTYMCCYVY